MRSPMRCGKPALGMALSGMLAAAASSRSTGSRSCGPIVQFAPTACTSSAFNFSQASAGRVPPNVVPSSEYVSCATTGSRENERIASIAAINSSRSLKVSRMKKSTPRSSRAAACSRKIDSISSPAECLHLLADSQRPNRAGEKNFVPRRFAGLARDFHAAMNHFRRRDRPVRRRRACGDSRRTCSSR